MSWLIEKPITNRIHNLQRERDDEKSIILSIFKEEITMGNISRSDVECKFFLAGTKNT